MKNEDIDTYQVVGMHEYLFIPEKVKVQLNHQGSTGDKSSTTLFFLIRLQWISIQEYVQNIKFIHVLRTH